MTDTSFRIGSGERATVGAWVRFRNPGPRDGDMFVPDPRDLFVGGARIESVASGRARLVNPAGKAFNYPVALLQLSAAGGSIPALLASSSFPEVGELALLIDNSFRSQDPFFAVPVALLETQGEVGTFRNLRGEVRQLSLWETRKAPEEVAASVEAVNRLKLGFVDPESVAVGVAGGGMAIGGVVIKVRHH